MSVQANKLQNGTLQDLYEDKSSELLRRLNCISLGKIEAFNPETQTARVSFNFKKQRGDKIYDYPVLDGVPCLVLKGGLGSLELPISAGDNCILLFCDRSIDDWIISGQVKEPPYTRCHDLSDALAIVGIRPLTAAISNFLADGVKLYYDDAKVQLRKGLVEISNSQSQVVLSGASATVTASSIILNGDVTVSGSLTASGDVRAGNISLQNHIHGGVQGGQGTTGPAQ